MPKLKSGLLRSEGTVINDLMTQYGLTQIIHKPTQLLDCSFSCIDLIFTLQRDLVTNSGVYSCLYSNCHRQIMVSEFN